MRVAVVDIGTNSTRLLVADVAEDGEVTELDRRSTVTRLGQGVDASGVLAPEAMERVFTTLGTYRAAMDDLGVEGTTAVLTSAVRDAANGAQFTARVREDFRLEAATLSGDEEAGLSFLGATSARPAGAPAPIVVIDIGGGSTEFVVGARGTVSFHVSTQAGVVRHGERHVRTDPPAADALDALAADAREIYARAVPEGTRGEVVAGVAVAGTATQLAAIAQELEPYDPTRVHGFRLDLATVDALRARLAAVPEAERRQVPGLDPARAPTIVPGTVLMGEAMRLFGLDAVEVSEHDILRGAALRRAGR
ncbi:MAG: Exopolyphosphatase [uncultured Solirubrobacteraceae bacterium]|uniref:Exopolyphosphatase n=1 Tax=uncultured Solirubrobacteraceae bacterium TaxID=1162706 RepID=A0A6J4THY5_9ACTN|nr:MAG: Exopolyphosphatase [uncultured Solirubrobacteraceae bacterium]